MRKGPSMRRAMRVLMLSGAAAMLGGCATTTGGGETRVFCASAAPITWSRADTDATIRQAKAHNAVGVALCGWH